MNPPVCDQVEAELLALSRNMSDRRKKYGSGCRPTREIWDKAIALCVQTPLVRVAEVMGVSANGLRNQKNAKRPNPKNESEIRQPQFLEIQNLKTAASSQSHSTPNPVFFNGAEGSRSVELQRGDGSRLRITDLEAHGFDLHALIQGFMVSPSSATGVFK